MLYPLDVSNKSISAWDINVRLRNSPSSLVTETDASVTNILLRAMLSSGSKYPWLFVKIT